MRTASTGGQVSRDIAKWIEDLSWPQIPGEVVENTKMRILDLIGVMLGGRSMPIVAKVRRTLPLTGSNGEAPMIGFPERTTLAGAALMNGILATALEFDDTHLDGPMHSTGPVVSAAFPFASTLAVSGRQLIASVLVGNELSCRLGQVAPGMFHHCGFQATGSFGTFGGVYAISKLLHLEASQIVDAIGIGASMTADCMASFEDGTAPKSLHVGFDASSAVQAVALARQGISGPAVAFDGRFGFFRSHVQVKDYDFRFDALTRRLGVDWEALDIVSKAYPCGYQIHPFLDAALELRARNSLDPGAIAEIVCLVADDAVTRVASEPLAEKLRPRNTWHARISLQHSIAEALVVGKLDKTAYAESNLRDPRINALADRIKCTIDPPPIDPPKIVGEVQIRLRDGTELRRRVQPMRGSRRNPMSRDDFLVKFRANASDVISRERMDQTIESILRLEDAEDVSPIFARLSE